MREAQQTARRPLKLRALNSVNFPQKFAILCKLLQGYKNFY
jgi:hypothetical protein